MAVVTAIGFSACSPKESDDHSLGGQFQDGLAFTVVPAESQNTYTFTNTSPNVASTLYRIDFGDGKSEVFPVGGTIAHTYKRAGAYNVQIQAFTKAGQSVLAQSVTVDKDLADPGWAGFGYDSADNLFANCNVKSYETWKGDNDWATVAGYPIVSPTDLTPQQAYSLNLGTATPDDGGSNPWRVQFKINTDIKVSSAKSYDYSVTLKANKTIPNAAIKVGIQGDDGPAVIYQQPTRLEGGQSCTLAWTDLPGVDGDVQIVFGLGGNEDGTELDISNITLREHIDGAEAPFVYGYESNLLRDAGYEISYYYAPGWSQIADPKPEADGTAEIAYDFSAATSDQWQNQVHIKFPDVKLDASKKYNFSVVLVSDKDFFGATVKPHPDGDDGTFFSEARHELKANVSKVVRLEECAGFDGVFVLTLDFAGNPDNTKVIIQNITLEEVK